MVKGDKFKVTKGNKKINIAANNTGSIRSIEVVPDVGVKVTLSLTYGAGADRVLWARSLPTTEKDSFNLGCGDGINFITITKRNPRA